MEQQQSLASRTARRARELWPYAAGLLLPGGTVVAAVMWLYRRRRSGETHK